LERYRHRWLHHYIAAGQLQCMAHLGQHLGNDALVLAGTCVLHDVDGQHNVVPAPPNNDNPGTKKKANSLASVCMHVVCTSLHGRGGRVCWRAKTHNLLACKGAVWDVGVPGGVWCGKKVDLHVHAWQQEHSSRIFTQRDGWADWQCRNIIQACCKYQVEQHVARKRESCRVHMSTYEPGTKTIRCDDRDVAAAVDAGQGSCDDEDRSSR